MSFLQGIAASDGIAIAKAFRLETHHFSIEKKRVRDSEEEKKRFHDALFSAKGELEMIRDYADEELGTNQAAILDAQLLVLADPELIIAVEEKITHLHVNAEFAIMEETDRFINMLESVDNIYLRERAADIRDITNRIQSHLLGIPIHNPSMIAEEVIIISDDLTPSHTAQLNSQLVKGFVTNIGGKTSHSAILARSMNIPAVVGAKTAFQDIENGDCIILDGNKGLVHINPTPEVIAEYEKLQQLEKQNQSNLDWLIQEKTVSGDGHAFSVVGNIGSVDEAREVIRKGGEGIGLFRTEFLFMEKKRLPLEDEQFEAYKTVLQAMEGKPVIVRTIDIGGDKELPYLHLSKEMNPFLGFRGIRFCLGEQTILRTQLRALLRASAFGNLKIMFPMVAVIEEFRQGKAMFEEEKRKLVEEGITVGNIELGMMVEIPSTALMVESFAKEADFFSIGTNDLIQYTLAADRMNEQVSYLYQPYHPAILRLIKRVIDYAHQEGKWVSICGDMAENKVAIPLLVGMGLDEFSVHSSSIINTRAHIRDLRMQDIQHMIDKVLNLPNAAEVEQVLENFLNKSD
ncbi:phosphoenolpyruvate--protein phosphotransferase [Cytobacillus purgationiresistens]|uniref:Phosphoenolpyruvate-protein phosphotransferase n=1 Tax=Cytobacillus purgationiresistens TaxID=863449 RepID=A0ABU0AHH1_9BACI|nr:phosphoenolpyruvate--protein phosphotransferase [Cytobacillus purgationiresistens]MDQ0270677.1 phosphotransferase system enzyme I (PtsI) [Cytobacillus purgationiresistens]